MEQIDYEQLLARAARVACASRSASSTLGEPISTKEGGDTALLERSQLPAAEKPRPPRHAGKRRYRGVAADLPQRGDGFEDNLAWERDGRGEHSRAVVKR
jgi:hypothetical protein